MYLVMAKTPVKIKEQTAKGSTVNQKEKDSLEKKLQHEETIKATKKIPEETEEETSQDLPFEMAEGITDTLDQVDIREFLQHSGEEQQKTRAHLEEELAEASWKPREEESNGEVNYGTIKKDSGENRSYVESREPENKDPVADHYKTMNPYATAEGQGDIYDVEHPRIERGQIGDIRREESSKLEIQGLTKKKDIFVGDEIEKNYQHYT